MSPAAARRLTPRTLLHRGTVEVAALWFDPVLLGPSEARARVLAMWTPGAGVYALEGGFLLKLPEPRRMACAEAPGLPLTQEGDLLLSAPLSATERERLGAPPGAAVLVRAGRAEAHVLDSFRRVEVSRWLDVSAWQVVTVETLGAPPPPVETLAPVAAPTRAHFGPGVPALAPEAQSLLARMEGRAAQPVPAKATRAVAGPSFFSRLMSALLDLLPGGARGQGGSGAAAPAMDAAPEPSPPPGPSLLSRLRQWASKALWQSPLGALLGRRKAEYVQRLFDLFEGGDLNEALRYAIPLGKGGLSEQARLSLGLPGPREQLAIQPRNGRGAATVFAGGPALYEALRERYRAAFKRLEREGRIEEAAFVLAELLREDEEAVSFLERHGKLTLAAELAEGRNLAPGLVVRQWLLAREVARAVAIARRTGAFADALLRLERTHPQEARALRLLWGEVLAEAGDYGRAVDVVWPLEDVRRLTLAWLERGVEVGGVVGARMLARMALTFPERLPQVREQVRPLLEDESLESASVREAFALTLAHERNRDARAGEVRAVLLRPAVRALLRDRALGHIQVKADELDRLLLATGDTVLRADVPRLPAQPVLEGFLGGGKAPEHTFWEGEGGPWPVYDAVALAGGRLLVALGEAGARLITADGRCVAHFDVPAFSLVRSVNEDRALALAPRGELQRVSRLDLGRRTAKLWCEVRAEVWAPLYDGDLWFLAVEDTVLAVDALAEDFRALWRVTNVGGRVRAVAVGPQELSFATLQPEGHVERWLYSLPGPTLRARNLLQLEEGERPSDSVSLWHEGELVTLSYVLAQTPDREGSLHFASKARWLGKPSTAGRPAAIPTRPLQGIPVFHLGGPWVVRVSLLSSSETWCFVELHDRAKEDPRARFSFEGPSHVSARFMGTELLLFDEAGRLARVDLQRGSVQRVVMR
jgi:hypothetical protein